MIITGVVGEGQLRVLARLSAASAMVLAGVILTGWAVGVEVLTRILAGTVATNPVAALCLLAAGAALMCRVEPTVSRLRRTTGNLLAGTVVITASLKLSEYFAGFDVGIDEVLFAREVLGRSGEAPNQMALNTALGFLLLGLGLLTLDAEPRAVPTPSQVLVLTAGGIALVALMGYSFRVLALYRLGEGIPMALPTALGMGALSLGCLAARAGDGFMAVVTSGTTGGALARRLLPLAVLVPWVLGAVQLAALRAGYHRVEAGIALFTCISIAVFASVIWCNARLLHRSDFERMRAENRLSLQYQCTKVLVECGDFFQAMPALLNVLCHGLGWSIGLLWKVDPESRALACQEAQQCGQGDLARFVSVSKTLKLAAGEGLPGRVLATRAAAWIPDVAADRALPRAQVAAETGLHGGFAFPITINGEVAAVVELFSPRVEPHDPTLLNVLSAVGGQIGLLMERHRADQQLRLATTELQRSNTELEQFASVVSHDLFEPLRMVVSYLQLLTQRHSGKLDPEAQEFVQFAVDAAKRMQGLIQALLAYARVGARGRDPRPTSAQDALETAMVNLKLQIEETQAAVVHGPLPMVMADPVQLTQVFQNLLGNALKFRGPAPPRIEVRTERRDGDWVFAVVDNGIGIDPKHATRIFEVFQRLHTRQEYAGTGMGLAICKRIVERHGGRIWVESEPGRGAAFYFTLRPVEASA